MNTTATTRTAEEVALDALLADLDVVDAPSVTAAPDEVILSSEDDISDADLEAAVAGAETVEVIAEHYDAETEVTDEPTVDPADPLNLLPDVAAETPVEAAPAPATPEKTKAEKKAEREAKKQAEIERKRAERAAKKAEKAAAAAAAPSAPTRKHYSSKSEAVADKLGDSLGDYLVLELADATLEGDALKAKQNETMQVFKEAGVKVQNRMGFFIMYAAGKTPELNAVAKIAMELLINDGELVTGEQGNFHEALLAKPLSVASAKAMGGNCLLAMQKLRMIVPNGEKQTFVANPNSLYLAKIRGMLGL